MSTILFIFLAHVAYIGKNVSKRWFETVFVSGGQSREQAAEKNDERSDISTIQQAGARNQIKLYLRRVFI